MKKNIASAKPLDQSSIKNFFTQSTIKKSSETSAVKRDMPSLSNTNVKSPNSLEHKENVGSSINIVESQEELNMIKEMEFNQSENFTFKTKRVVVIRYWFLFCQGLFYKEKFIFLA